MNPKLWEEIIALIISFGPLAVEKFLRLESIVNLGPDEKQNIANLITASNAADQDTIDRVAAWQKANQLPPTT